jgi:hypothetical protein
VNFTEWLEYGLDKKFVIGPNCATHHGIPTTEEEDQAWEEGEDPCEHILRLADSPKMWDDIQTNTQKNYS